MASADHPFCLLPPQLSSMHKHPFKDEGAVAVLQPPTVGTHLGTSPHPYNALLPL